MTPSFNLLREKWIPCVRKDGTVEELSLREVLARSHELQDLVGDSPLETAALLRLLLAVLHRVFGPEDTQVWENLYRAGHWDMGPLSEYLDRWEERFDLFHPKHPFYQASDPRVKPKSVASLVLEIASGNNATLFDHHLEEEGLALSPARAARALVAAQAFGLSGTSGLREKFTAGPCARGVLFLAQGDTLFETLALNLTQYPQPSGPLPTQPDDRPCWELDDPWCGAERGVPKGLLDYLTWQSRRVLLLPEMREGSVIVAKMTLAPGRRLSQEVRGPMKLYRMDKRQGFRPARFLEERALWRDSAALFRAGAAGGGHEPPHVFRWLADLVEDGCLPTWQRKRYAALGMASNQAKVSFFRSERMPLPLAFFRRCELVDYLEAAINGAEAVAQALSSAAYTLAFWILAPQGGEDEARQPARQDLESLTGQWAVARSYWPYLEVPFRQMVESLPANPDAALAEWRGTVRETALEALRGLIESLDRSPRTLKASVRASGRLSYALAHFNETGEVQRIDRKGQRKRGAVR